MEKGKSYPSLKENRNLKSQIEVLFKRAWWALIKGPLQFSSRKKGKRKYTKKEQLYWDKNQVLYLTWYQFHFLAVEGWHLSTGTVYSGRKGITGIANKVDALTAVSERTNFLLCQRQDNPESHKAA